ncbi:MAG: MarR family transcriptional regulator [Caldilineaceae bacterium]|nr:MarR family transcriptional regulator [Caldilineaceae bacterium]
MTTTTTNQTASEGHRAAFSRLLAEVGVTETHGLELLRLVKMCNGAYDTILGQQMREDSVSSPQWRLLARLLVADQSGDKSLTPTELARSQRLSKNTVSAHLRSLEERGLIEREIDPDDLRAFRIQLSEAGRLLMRHSLPIHIGFLNDLTTDLTGGEIEQLETLLEKLHHSLLHCIE